MLVQGLGLADRALGVRGFFAWGFKALGFQVVRFWAFRGLGPAPPPPPPPTHPEGFRFSASVFVWGSGLWRLTLCAPGPEPSTLEPFNPYLEVHG